MESFKQEIKFRMKIMILVAVAGGACVLVAFIIWLISNLGAVDATSPRLYQMLGTFLGLEIVAVYRIVKYKRAIEDKEVLKTLEIRETDERNVIITMKTCKTALFFLVILLALGAIIASFFSQIVFLALGFVLILTVLVYSITKIYISRKY